MDEDLIEKKPIKTAEYVKDINKIKLVEKKKTVLTEKISLVLLKLIHIQIALIPDLKIQQKHQKII